MRFILLLVFLLLPAASPRADQEAAEAFWAALAGPGVVAVMRHARAPGTGDPAGFRLDDPATQRNLDERGRAQARAIGAALRARGFAFDRVMTSQWARCQETAALMGVGPVEDLPSLNSFFADREDGPARTRETIRFLRGLDPAERVLLVTHQVNVTALTGVYPASGEIVAGVTGPDGFETLARLRLDR